MALYEICVKIGDRRNSESSAHLFVRLNGRSNRVPRQKLVANLVEDDNGNRTRYAHASRCVFSELHFLPKLFGRHIFKIRGPSLRDVTSIVIETDALLEEDSVYIDDIAVEVAVAE